MQTHIDPVIIIGSGMAGYSLARELRKLNAEIPINIICRDAGDNYSKPTLSNAFAQNKLADTIPLANAEKMAESLQLTILNFHQVLNINPQQKTITIQPVNQNASKQTLSYSQLVLATGANSRILPNISVNQQQIFAVNHLDEYRQFQQALQRKSANSTEPVKVVIIGAGLIGCEFANDLATQKNLTSQQPIYQVTLLDKAEYAISQLLPKIASETLQTALTNIGIQLQLGVEIEKIQQNQSYMIIHAIDKTGQSFTIDADFILLAVGLVANTQLAEQAKITTINMDNAVNYPAITSVPNTAKQGILVNQYLQTSAENIYAIGDCANVMGSFMPYVMPLMNQAKALAKTLSNSQHLPTAVTYPAMPVAVKTPSCPLVVLPIAQQYSNNHIEWQQCPTTDGYVLMAHHKENKQLLGFVLVGKEAGKQRLSLVKQIADWLPTQN